MLLNILLTKRCNANCYFCIENTKVTVSDSLATTELITIVNRLIAAGIVTDILLLGGEPMLYKNIQHVIAEVALPCILTTNGTYLPANFPWSKLRALNVSIPHYDRAIRSELMRVVSPTNTDWVTKLGSITIPKRMNTLLLQSGIHKLVDIEQMLALAQQLTFDEVKFGELTGYKPAIYDFIAPETVTYNLQNYAPIPVLEMYEVCHRLGGTHLWRVVNGMKVYFNAAPDHALRGGYDQAGQRYHIVLFNDGKLGWSWRREDGLYDVDGFIEAYNQQVKDTKHANTG